MNKNEKKNVIKILKRLHERYGDFNAIAFEGQRYGIVNFPLEKMNLIGVFTDEGSFSPEITIIKVTDINCQNLLYISKEPIEFNKERVYKTIQNTDTRGEIYFFDVDLGDKEIYKSNIGLMLRERGKVSILHDLDCHLDKRPVRK